MIPRTLTLVPSAASVLILAMIFAVPRLHLSPLLAGTAYLVLTVLSIGFLVVALLIARTDKES